jgi:hypothetical protein
MLKGKTASLFLANCAGRYMRPSSLKEEKPLELSAVTGLTGGLKKSMKDLPKKTRKIISAGEFDKGFDQGKDISTHLDFDKATVVKRVNVDFPAWMVKGLDREAVKLNVSRQAIIKMWVHEHLR